MLVPDHMRGRVMGFYGMTYSLMPLGGMQASAVASVIGAPWAISIGGMAVSVFAVATYLTNGQVRGLGALLMRSEKANSEEPEATEIQSQPARTSMTDKPDIEAQEVC